MKKYLFLPITLLTTGLLAGCGGTTTSKSSSKTESSSSEKQSSSAESSSQESSSSSEEEVDELTRIMRKYDNLTYEYDGDPCKITMAHWTGDGDTIERAVINAVLQGFKLRYPTIDVELSILGDYENTYPNRFQAGNAHDVFMMPDGSFASWAKSGACMNLTPFIAASELVVTDEMYTTSLSRYRYDATTGKVSDNGNQLSLPKDIGPMVMYYNKDAFDEMGVEYPDDDEIMDIEDATEMWKKLTKKKDGNIIRYGVSGLSIEGLVWSAGGDFLNPTRDHFPSDPLTIQGLKDGYQFIQDAYVTNFITPPSEFTAGSDGKSLFSQQRVACFIGLKSNVAAFRQLSFNWDCCPIPAFQVEPEKNGWSGSVGYSVYQQSKHKDAAWKLVEYIASKEGQEILSATGFQIPVYPELSEDPVFLAREIELGPHNFGAFLSAAENQPYGLWQYRSSQTWKTLGYDTPSERLLSSDPSTRLTVEEFLAIAKEKVEQNIG